MMDAIDIGHRSEYLKYCHVGSLLTQVSNVSVVIRKMSERFYFVVFWIKILPSIRVESQKKVNNNHLSH
jgi:hypothetical protein